MLDLTAPIAKARREDDPVDEVERLAAKMQPGLTKAIQAYLARLQDSVNLEALIEALKSGDVQAVISALASLDTGAAEAAVASKVQEATWAGAGLAALQINTQLTGVEFAFDRLNPTLVSFLRSYSLRLIREIDDRTREGIRTRLVDGMEQGANPVSTARDVKQTIGLTRRQQAAVGAYRKELETFHERRSAAGWGLGKKISRRNGRQTYEYDEDGGPADGIRERRLRDFRYDGRLQTALDSGKPIPPEKIDDMVAAYARKYLRHRSETIARTESLRATNYGVQEGWRQAIEDGKFPEEVVRRKWKVAADERLCPVCSPIPKLNPAKGVPFATPFATPEGPAMLPPIHPNCRCSVFIRAYEPGQLA